MVQTNVLYHPFMLTTPRFVLLPTPSAIHIRAWRDFYSHLHFLKEFCEMGFGSGFEVKTSTDARNLRGYHGPDAAELGR